MKDLTLLYYTANTIREYVAKNVRNHLLEITKGEIPIISVSQKPIDFGTNIYVGKIGRSYYNCYKQIYIGACEVKTKYVACCEDDTIYNMEHFTYRPSSDDVFAYNISRWFSEPRCFWQRPPEAKDYGMDVCIAPTELLVKTLEARYKMYPNPVPLTQEGQKNWQEPGKFDYKFGIENPKIEFFETKIPNLVFNYRGSLGGKKGTWANPQVVAKSLPFWGDAKSLWSKFWNQPTAIFIPTFGRSERLIDVYKNARKGSCFAANVYFIVEKRDQKSIDVLNASKLPYFVNERAGNYAGAINTAYLKTTEKYFFCGADDLDFKTGWLDAALKNMAGAVKVVGTNDLHNREVLRASHATHYLVDRDYIKERSGVFDKENLVLPEDYVHNWTDKEFIEIAKLRGVFAPCLESVVEHLHWGWGLSPKDDTYKKQDGAWNKDLRLYRERRARLIEKIMAE